MTPKSQETRELLLHAAIGLLMEGNGVFTLDAVAKRAGVSKGGLIHHFSSKEALIEGVVGEMIRQFASQSQLASNAAAIGSVEETKAYIEVSLEPSLRAATADFARGMIRLHAADYQKEAPFLNPWRKLFSQRLEQVRQNSEPRNFAKSAIVTLAVECFTMIDVFDLVRFTDEELELIKQELVAYHGK